LDAEGLDAEGLTPDELEARADSVRDQVAETLAALRLKLAPRSLIDEMAERSGVRDLDAGSIVDFAVRKHPVASGLAGLCVGLWAWRAFRASPETGPGLIRQTMGDLSQSAKQALKNKAQVQRTAFVRAAEAQLSAGAQHLSDAVETGVRDLVARTPAPPEAKPLIESAAQIILIAAFEALFDRVRRRA